MFKVKAHILIDFLLILSLIGYSEETSSASNIHPRKVIWLLFDAMRADHLSCYGYERKTTPTIDSLAEKGVLFKNHYTQGLNTFFSIPSLM